MSKAKAVTTLNPLDEVLSIMATAVEEWKVKNNEAAIRERVFKLLDSRAEEIVLKLLGFRDCWGKWELDHCNGRSGESAAGDYIKKVSQSAIEEWLKGIEMPVLSDSLKNKFAKDLQADFKQRVQYQAHQIIQSKADQATTAAINELCTSHNIDNYLQTIKLLAQGINHAS